MRLDPSTINELVELLRPYMEDERNRRSILLLALGNDVPVLQHITWSGSVVSFTSDVVYKLADYGEVEPGRQALWALLEYVRSQTGVDIQQRIDKLRPLIDWRSHSCLPTDTSSSVETPDIDVLVQKVRSRLHDKILRLHGTMQLWDVACPMEIDRLYVDVNILAEPTSYMRFGIDDLLSGRDYRRDFNRFGLSEKRKRVSGLKAVVDYPKLMVLGKPGAGKTTFLQHLVIECNNGNLLANRVPIFIKLRDLFRKAKKTRNFNLEHHIGSYLQGCTQLEAEALLEEGKVLLLLDGLDEVPGADGDAVVDEIEEFIDNYDQNQLIITCRIQAQKYRFPHFAYVEVADFKPEQVATFARKWFVATARNGEQEGQATAEQFIETLYLPENQQIRDLAVTPILLSLTCKVFSDKGKFYSKPAELYKQGLNLLLFQWDEQRRIARDQVYRNLSVSRKQELLSYVAASKFEQEQYVLFEQEEIQTYIADYLGISKDETQAVLETIEVQHGLLVERAQRIYSFSHLTFQEYFTAKWFVERADWKNLVIHITHEYWREVFILAVGIVDDATELFQLIKQQVDALVATDKNLQQFLMGVKEKSCLVNVPYKPVAVRAFYLELVDTRDCVLDFELDLALEDQLKLDRELELAFKLDRGLELAFEIDSQLASVLISAREVDRQVADTLELDNLDPERIFNREVEREIARVCDFDPVYDFEPEHDLDSELASILTLGLAPELKCSLQQLKHWLPDPYGDGIGIEFKYWWQANSQAWIGQLRSVLISHRNAVMISHRNNGQEWQFSDEQEEVLQQYYDANLLLVDCLNSGCVVSDRVREEIEETLLLPIAEIQKRRGTRAEL